LGRWTMGLQPAGATRTDFPAGLLGTHRVRLWTLLDSAQAQREHSHGVAWAASDFPFYVVAVPRANQAERTRSTGLGLAAETRRSRIIVLYPRSAAEIWRTAFCTRSSPIPHCFRARSSSSP